MKTAEFVCSNLDRHSGHEYRFTQRWFVDIDPADAGVRCPRCHIDCFVDFKRWLPE
jgi:hypothetical protein